MCAHHFEHSLVDIPRLLSKQREAFVFSLWFKMSSRTLHILNQFLHILIEHGNLCQNAAMLHWYQPCHTSLSWRRLNNAPNLSQILVRKNCHGHFQRGPLTSDLKLCEWKWVLWVPTSLPFTDTPTAVVDCWAWVCHVMIWAYFYTKFSTCEGFWTILVIVLCC